MGDHAEFRDSLREKVTGNADEQIQHEKEIYTYINENLIKTESTKHVPLLEVCIHTVRQILQSGSLESEDITDLLDLLGDIEMYRAVALKRAGEALDFDTYYRSIGKTDSRSCLEPGAKAELQSYILENDIAREVYIDIGLLMCQLDIYCLWTSPNLQSKAELLLHFNQFFPDISSSDECEGEACTRHGFTHGLTTDERELLNETGYKCAEMIADSKNWLEEQGNGIPWNVLIQTSEFLEANAPPVHLDMLVESIEEYLTSVGGVVHEIESMFS